MNKPRLFLFWEGPKPVRIKLCEETVRRHCSEAFDLHFLNYTNIWEYIDKNDKISQEIINNPNITVIHKMDYIRTVVLYETGGFWIDSDFIVFKEFSGLTRFLKNRDFSGVTCLFCCSKRSPTIKQWREDISKLLLSDNPPGYDDSRYLEPSELLFTQKGWKHQNGITLEMIRPISWKPAGIKKLYSTDTLVEDVVTDKTYAVTIWNSLVPDWFDKLSKKEILNADYLISKLYRKGLGIE